MDNDELKHHFDAVRGGDKQAFTSIYNELKTPIYAVINRITHDEALSNDVMHDVFVKLFCSPPEPSVKNPRAWVFQMAHNLAIDSIRRPVQSELSEEIEDTKVKLEETVGTRLDIESSMQRLPHDEFEIVMMRVNGELKFKEVANILCLPLGTVFWKYQKAITKLRTYLNGGVV